MNFKKREWVIYIKHVSVVELKQMDLLRLYIRVFMAF